MSPRKRKTDASPAGTNARTAAGSGSAKKSPRKRNPVTAVVDDPQAVGKSPLSAEQIEHFRRLLLQRRRQILGDVDAMSGSNEPGSRQDATGDLSSMPIHMADIGTDNYEQEFKLGLIESDRKQLEEIDHALAKIRKGTYGICEGTGRPIGLARLEAKPEARYCIEYARMLEKGLVKPPAAEDEEES